MGNLDAIYARQSVDRTDSISIESQIEFCKREVTGEGVKVYTDRGYSGKNTDRPAFQEMMRNIEAGKIRRVIVYRLDRISRSVLDFASVIDKFQKHGVDFVSTMEKFDTGTPVGKAMLMIVMIFAQLERETIQQRVSDAYHSRCKRGFYMGGKVPYGFRLKETVIDGIRTKMYEPVSEEAAVIKRIFSMYAQPQTSLGDIARWLEEQQIKKRDGKPFSRSRIRDLLINPIYVRADGRLYRFFKDQGAVLENPPEDFIGTNGAYLYSNREEERKTASLRGHTLVLAPHEGLVPSDIWIQCRRKCLRNEKTPKPIKAKATWLAGKIKCAHCGYALSAKVYHCKTKADNRYYLCGNKARSGRCEFGSLDADYIDKIVLEEIRQKLEAFKVLTKRKPERSDLRTSKLKTRLEAVDQEISLFLDKVPMAGKSVMTHINKRVAQLESQKRELQAELRQHTENVENCLDQIVGYLENWEKLSFCDRLTVADTLIESIFASQQEIKIIWKI